MRPDPYALARFSNEAHVWVPRYLSVDHFKLADQLGRPVDVYPPGFEFMSPDRHILSQRASGSEMRRVMGHDGSPVIAGEVDLFDHNRLITPWVWRGTDGCLGRVDEMRRSSPVVGAIWTAFEAYMSTAPWPKVTPRGTDRVALEMARFLRDALFEHSATPWTQYLRSMGPFPLSGTALAEVTWRMDRGMGQRYGLGSQPMVTLADVKPRRLNTVYQWKRITDDRTTATRWGVEQYPDQSDADFGETRQMTQGEFLHPDKLVHLRWSQDGEAPEGVGMLRPGHASFILTKTLRKALAVGADRSSSGVPYFKVLAGYGRGSEAELRLILQEYRSGARSNLGLIPEGVELLFAEMPFKGDMIDKALKSEEMAIARACSMPWLFTGVDNGTEALMRAQMLTTKPQLRMANQTIVDAWSFGPHAQANRLIRANWGDVPLELIPSLTAPEVQLGDPVALVELFERATAAGMLTLDGAIEAQIREVAGASPMPVETSDAWEFALRNPEGSVLSLDTDQVTAAISIAEAVKAGAVLPSAGVSMLVGFFDIPQAQAIVMVNGDGTDEEPEPEPEPVDNPSISAPSNPRAIPEQSEGADDVEADDVPEETGNPADDAEAQGDEVAARANAEALLLRARAGNFTLLSAHGEIESGPNGRPLIPIERYVRLRETRDAMQGGREEFAAVIERWRTQVTPKMIEQMTSGDEVNIENARKVAVPARGRLAEQLEDVLRSAHRAGGESVQAELDRQARDPELREAIAEGDVERGEDAELPAERPSEIPLRSATTSTLKNLDALIVAFRSSGLLAQVELLATRRKVKKPKVVAEGSTTADDIDPEEALRAIAGTSADNAAARLKGSLLDTMQSGSTAGVVSVEAVGPLQLEMSFAAKALSLGPDLVQGQKDVNTMFGLGRIQTARSLPDVETEAVFSNLIESETCDPCGAANGRTVAPSEMDEFSTPYSECEGGDMCNCALIFRFKPKSK